MNKKSRSGTVHIAVFFFSGCESEVVVFYDVGESGGGYGEGIGEGGEGVP